MTANVQPGEEVDAHGPRPQLHVGAHVTGPAVADPSATAGPDLQEAIQAATDALNATYGPDWFGPHLPSVARYAVEGAWPHAEGVIANARAKVDRQRIENARTQRSHEDLRAHVRGLNKQIRDLADKLHQFRTFEQAIRAAAAHKHDTSAAIAMDKALAALDAGRAT